MKTCPYCSKEVQDAATRCGHCSEILVGPQRRPIIHATTLPWYFRTSTIVIAVMGVGPLALPLIWWRPRTSYAWKVALSVLIFIVSWIMFKLSMKALAVARQYYDLMNGV